MPRLLSLALAYLAWAWVEEHPAWVAARPDPVGLVGTVGAAWLLGLRWSLPRLQRPWEAGPLLSFLGPQLFALAFLAAFGGVHLWRDWELPAAVASWIGVLPYLVVQHGFRRGEAALLGLDPVRATAFAERQSQGLLLALVPLALVSQLWEWGMGALPPDPAAWTRAQEVAALVVELGAAALALPVVLLLLPRLLGATEGLPALQAQVDAGWRGSGPPPRVLAWDTQGLLPNALAVGFGSRRRILVSDALQARLEPHELNAVLAHEMAHLERRHAAALVAGAAGAVMLALGELDRFLPAEAGVGWGLLALLAAAPPFLFASRRFEQQADLDAIDRAPVHAGGLTAALCRLGGLHRRLSLRHPPVPKRLDEIRHCLADPARAEAHHRRAGRARMLLWGLFGAGLLRLLAAT
jgi:Zn-dependent protease with chaperone function